MNAAQPPERRARRLWRPAGMLLRPGATLETVASQPADTVSLYLGYIAPLAAVGPLCGAVGLIIFGGGIAGLHMRMSPWPTLGLALADYAFALAGVYLLSLAIWALAPLFGARANRVQALKLVAYASTALWLAGVFSLYPALGLPLMVLGALYSLYALYLGLGRVMAAPAERTLSYFAAVLVLALVLGVLLRIARGRLA